MAKKLKQFDFSAQSTMALADKATYPWDEWFDGDIWELTYGEDFQGHPLMMERIIRTRATARQARVTMRHIPVNGDPWGKIVVQRTDLVGPEEAKRQQRKAKAALTRASHKRGEATPAPDATEAPKRRVVRSKVPV